MITSVKKTFTIGIDLGGTSIKAGAVDNNGKILSQCKVDTKAHKGPPSVIQQILFSIQEILGKHKQSECHGIGIGTPGIVDLETGVVKHPPNFSDWKEIALAKAIRKVIPLPVFIENDANAAALAEVKYGIGIEHKNFLFVIWGSGVGGGIIMNHKIFRGPHGGAGEIGHISIDYNGPECNCGSRGCIESYIGQRYLSERTKEIITNQPAGGPPSIIPKLVDGNLSFIEPSIISEAAEKGDTVACDILREAGELLGYALASVLNIIDLRVVVIGGGISAAPEFVFTAIGSGIQSRVLKPLKPGIKVLRSNLGNNAGILGASSLVM